MLSATSFIIFTRELISPLTPTIRSTTQGWRRSPSGKKVRRNYEKRATAEEEKNGTAKQTHLKTNITKLGNVGTMYELLSQQD